MSETASASTDDGDDTGITVDTDAPADSKDAVTRARKPTKQPRKGSSVNQDDEVWAARSKKVQKRIVGMQRNFDQRLAEQQAEFQRQLADRDRRIDALSGTRVQQATTDEAAHQTAMDALQAKLEAAYESGDSKEAAKIQREMSTLEGKFWAAQTAKQTGTQQRTETGDGKGTSAVKPGARPPTKAGLAFIQANADWWNDTSDEEAMAAKAFANALHGQMLNDPRFDPDKPEYFERIRAKVAKRFPGIETIKVGGPDDDDEDDDEDADGEGNDALREGERHQQQQRRGPALSLPNRGEATQRQQVNRNGGMRLTPADIKTMRATGMDPANDKHVLEFGRQKALLAQEEA